QANVPLVLGSATPSLESWYRARSQRDRLVSMPSRVADRPLPVVTTIDLRDEFRRPGSRGALAQEMVVGMEEALAAEGQIILLLNRRGFSTHIQCPACGEVLKCSSCDIALTQHAEIQRVVCHYCDFQESTPDRCPACRFDGIRFGGLGTERLEAEVQRRFPDARVLRMDTDTMRRPGSHEEALDRFRQGEVDILLGTQMIAKGLDFPTVTLVGVINADTALHLPDFRAGERTFQLVTQVAGRTGRGTRRGKVLVQSYNPEHFAIQAATQHDYVKFADHELEMRTEFNYPPVTQLIRIVFRGAAEESTKAFAEHAAQRVRAQMESDRVEARMLGPVAAPLAKLRGKFRYHFLIQTKDLIATADVVRRVRDELNAPPDIQWIVDVDAISML
ncbi:MAG: primosomal protein N', partial [Planctomycetota bacterium]